MDTTETTRAIDAPAGRPPVETTLTGGATDLGPTRLIIHGGQILDQPRLGVDIGRVIISGDAHPAGGDTAFFEGDETTMLATAEVAGAVEAITALTARFAGRVWLVSKCGARVEARTRRWLAGHDFFGRTGIDQSHLRFCRFRAQKRVHCVELGLTHFVDDRIGVHAAIESVVAHQYLFGPQVTPAPAFVTPAPDWPTTRRLIEATLFR
jgi:hypothetical protein